MREIHMASVVCFLVATGLCVVASQGFAAVPTNSQNVPISIDHEKGSFHGNLRVTAKGPMKKVRIRWNGVIKNASPQKIHRANLCVKAFGPDGEPFQIGKYRCFFRLLGSEWEAGRTLTFKGKDQKWVAPSKKQVQVSWYEISVSEVLDHAPNFRSIETRCALVWNPAIQAFADKDFHPRLMDKDSLTGSFEYTGGMVGASYRAGQMLRSFTQANMRFLGPQWDGFRIDNASIYLRDGEPGSCNTEVKMSFSGFGKPFMGKYYSWYKVPSNFAYEEALLDEIEKLSIRAREIDMDRAIQHLPTDGDSFSEPVEPAELTITSEPPGVEIEINGEWIGNTPTTLKVDAGKIVLKMTLGGYRAWDRTFTTSPSDKRTIHVSLTKEP